MAMPAHHATSVPVAVGPRDSYETFHFFPRHFVKVGGRLETKYKKREQIGMNHGDPEVPNRPIRITCERREVDVFGYLHKIIISDDQYILFNELFPPEQGQWHSQWHSGLGTLIDVYFLAERLKSDCIQNKIMDSLMAMFREPENLNNRPFTWTLTKLLHPEKTRSSQLAFFLIDLVAFSWLSNPLPEMNDAIIRPWNGDPGDGSLDVFLSIGNKEVIKRLMCRILQQQQVARGRRVWVYDNPAFYHFCKYHVHTQPLIDPCPGARS